MPKLAKRWVHTAQPPPPHTGWEPAGEHLKNRTGAVRRAAQAKAAVKKPDQRWTRAAW